MPQRGFAPILVVLIIGIIAGISYFGALHFKVIAPQGCHYEKVECFTTPCDPILVCNQTTKPVPDQKACTLEAKICPDGSSVGRSGPNCEFAACPISESTPSADMTNWKLYSENGFSFRYPSSWFADGGTISNYDTTKVERERVFGMLDNDQIKIDIYLVSGTKKPTYSGEPPNDTLVSESTIMVGGEKAWKQIVESYVEGGGKTIIISIPHNNQILGLEIRPAETKYQDTLNQILSTFKFLP